jgi:hypothetical protein
MGLKMNLMKMLLLSVVLPLIVCGNDRDELLTGVKKIGAEGSSATQWLVCGKNSFAVAHDGSGASLIAAAQVGKGRIVFLPGRDWLPSAATAEIGDMEQFYKNLVQWCGVEKSMKAVSNRPETVDWLNELGVEASRSGNPSQFKAGLQDARLIMFELNSGLISVWPEILDIAEKGGCVVLSSNVWNPKDLEKLNALGKTTGVYFTGQRISRNDVRGWERYGHFVVKPSTDAANLINFKTSAKTEKELVKAIESLGTAKGAREIQNTFYPGMKSRLTVINPSLENPVSDPLEKALLSFEGGYIQDTPSLHTVPHRTALPVGKAQRVTREIEILKIQKQVDTGLYALPGVPVKLSVPTELVGKKVQLKISHLRTDLKDKEFLMVPNQVFQREIDSATIDLVSPYGGLVMLQFPKDTDIKPCKIKIGNAVEAPRFTLGKTSDEEWVKSIRNRPTPFGILESDAVIFIAHSSWLRKLDDPTRVMEYWNRMMRLEDEFYNYTGDTLRIHHDFQPVGGFSSFPQSYPVSMELLNYRQLITSGAPLTLHEHGHHGGKGFMNFEGMGEATANMGGLYVMDKGMDFQWKGSHRAIDRISTFQSLPTDQNMWKSGSHSHNQQRYTTFASLAHAWGFDAFRNTVHRLKEANGNGSKESQLVTDNWLRFFSDEADADLSDFLELWHLSFSDEAKGDVSNYKKWQLIERVEDRVVCKAGEEINIMRPHLNDFSYDGVLKPGKLSRPNHGTVVKVDDSLLAYRPAAGFTGTDSFTYEVSNGVGNTFIGTVEIRVLAEADFPKIEFGTVEATSDGWKKINPAQAFKSPVLAVFPVVSGHAELVGVDVKPSADGTFTVKPFAMQGGKVAARIDYMVVEEGHYTEARNGIKMEAVKTKVDVNTDGVCLLPMTDYAQEPLEFYRDPITFGSVVGGAEKEGRFVSVNHRRGAQYQVGIAPAPKEGGTVNHITLDSFSSMQIGRHAIYSDRSVLGMETEIVSPYPIDHLFVVDHSISKRGETTLLAVADGGAVEKLKTLNGLFPAPKGKPRPQKPFKTNAMMVHDVPSL